MSASNWAPTYRFDDYDHDLFDAVSQNFKAEETLDSALKAVESLLLIKISDNLGHTLRRLLFANAITALETFLSDTFVNRVFAHEALLQSYIDHEPKFSEYKIPYKEVLRESKRVEAKAKKELLDVVWHNVAKFKPMYKQVLHVDLGDVSSLGKAIQTRHDIVHRNGRQKDGTVIVVDDTAIKNLVNEIRKLSAHVQLTLSPAAPVESYDSDEDIISLQA